MRSCLLAELVRTVLQQSSLGLFCGETCLHVCPELDLKLFKGDLVIGHDLELFSKLNSLIERSLSLLLDLDLLGPGLDSFLEL